MKYIIGILLIVAGIIAGLYIGVWLCFIGGIIGIIEQVRATSVDTTIVAFCILRIICAGLVGWLSAFCLAMPGVYLIAK